jgi:hypothetical protein
MTKTLDNVLRLLNKWDEKQATSIAAAGLDIERVRRQVQAASVWGMCKAGEAVSGDGTRDSVVKLLCDRGTLLARFVLDPETHRLSNFNLAPSREQRCVP